MLQAPNSLPLQICAALLQSGAVRQSPVTQRLFRQMWFAPTLGSFRQALSLAQAPHSWEVGSQICPPVQVLVSWQLPLIHTPPEQMWSVPYSAVQSGSAEQAPQVRVPVLQMRPLAAQPPLA